MQKTGRDQLMMEDIYGGLRGLEARLDIGLWPGQQPGTKYSVFPGEDTFGPDRGLPEKTPEMQDTAEAMACEAIKAALGAERIEETEITLPQITGRWPEDRLTYAGRDDDPWTDRGRTVQGYDATMTLYLPEGNLHGMEIWALRGARDAGIRAAEVVTKEERWRAW